MGKNYHLTVSFRWALSYNLRSEIAEKTHEMFCLRRENVFTDNESSRGRLFRDNKDEDSLYRFFEQYNVFSPTSYPECLYNIATKDLVTEEIQESLLSAKHLGQRQVGEFVSQRLIESFMGAHQSNCEQDKAKQIVLFSDTMHRNNPPTFDTLYQVSKASKEKDKNTIFRADRSVLQRLLIACQAGREVDLLTVLSHELMPVPVSLAETNGKLRTGQKAVLANVLTNDTECPKQIELQGRACLLIDGMALVAAIGKPTDAKTFGDLGDKFLAAVFGSGSCYHEIHVLFDRYEKNSIKAGTRERRTKTTRPIRRVIENQNVPLPTSWPNFLALPENKADLARFLSEHLITNAPHDKVIVVAGGFNDRDQAQCSNEEIDSTMLFAAHEEADTRIIYHCIASNCDTVVVSARDTDVLLLLVAHAANIRSANIWMMAGTTAHKKFFNIRAICENLPAGSLSSVLPFHALTGCDTTSFLCNHSKTTAWKIFLQKHNLLSSLGEGSLTASKIKNAEKFVCAMYKHGEVESVNQVRVLLFPKCGKPQALPPTRDALELHIRRCHYQAFVWKQACCQYPILPNPDGTGWMKVDGDQLVPRLMTLDPIPKACKEIISCSCKSECTTLRCGCKRAKLFCTSVCGCTVNSEGNNCCKNKPTS